MGLIAGRMGAASGEEIKIDAKLRKEFEIIAKQNVKRINPWDELAVKIIKEYCNRVSNHGLAKMLSKVRPNTTWTSSMVRDRVRRLKGMKW